MDDLSVDDLLAAVATPKPKRSHTEPITKETTWMYSPSTYECLGCKRVYHGQRFHPSISPPNPGFVAWCPKCLNPDLFWTHQYFKVESVVEVGN